MAQQIGASEPKVLEEGWGFPPGTTVNGDLTLFAPLASAADQVKIREDHLIVVDLQTGETQTIPVPSDCFAAPPPTDGHYAVGYCTSDAPSLLWGLDLETMSTFPITVADGDIVRAPHYSFADGVLAWSEQQQSGWSVRTASITDLLPSARQPDPGTTSPNWLYFAATGHFLSAGFMQFWSQSGGVPVFGFPVTEEFTEQGLTVQYLERQRYEYYPEFALTPYETELGLLGSEDANQRVLLSNAAFQPSTGTSDATCTFVAETSHKLCGMFRSYWQGHGLEFNDPGISYREALALFGYPISDEYTDPATGLVTQYFERARFEYHPENPAASQVLLGRLGADVIAERGW